VRLIRPSPAESLILMRNMRIDAEKRDYIKTVHNYQGNSPGIEVCESEVVVMIPSRNRPESLKKAYESVRATSGAGVLAFIDDDQGPMYAGLEGLPGLRLFIAKRHGPVHACNTLCGLGRPGGALREFYPNANIWTYMTDDSTIGPPGWDKWLIEKIKSFPNEIGVVSASHGGADYVNFYAVSTKMVEALGWYAFPNVNAWIWDTAMELIGDATRIYYSKPTEMNLDHAPQATIEPLGIPKEDCWNFVLWCVGERKRVIESVRRAM
jgi:hypothetical protein